MGDIQRIYRIKLAKLGSLLSKAEQSGKWALIRFYRDQIAQIQAQVR
jgi:hypothetical protein